MQYTCPIKFGSQRWGTFFPYPSKSGLRTIIKATLLILLRYVVKDTLRDIRTVREPHSDAHLFATAATTTFVWPKPSPASVVVVDA